MICNEGYGACPDVSYISYANGSRIWDHGGRELIDLALGGGSMILGHDHPVVTEAIRRQSVAGTIYTSPHAGLHEMDELLNQFIPWLPSRVWCNSGSEAVMRLYRIARAATGKDKIAVFSGCWHGSWDGTLVEEDYDASGIGADVCWPAMKLRSAGILSQIRGSLLMLPYRDPAALDRIRERKDELACVLIEPVQGSNPSDEAGPFLHALRDTTRDCGTLLAFDEVVTGFRLAPGGGQERFGVHADLAAYGKVLGGGLPVGMVAGTQEILYSARSKGVFFGGTFSGNPLTTAAGLATLRHLNEWRIPIYGRLESMGAALRLHINTACHERSLPAHMIGCDSISRLLLTARPVHSRRERDQFEHTPAIQDRFYAGLRERGIHIGSNRILFLSSLHYMADTMTMAEAIVDELTKFDWKEQ